MPTSMPGLMQPGRAPLPFSPCLELCLLGAKAVQPGPKSLNRFSHEKLLLLLTLFSLHEIQPESTGLGKGRQHAVLLVPFFDENVPPTFRRDKRERG